MPEFQYQEMFPLAPDETPYRQIGGTETVRAIDAGGHRILQVDPSALTELAAAAMRDIAHLLRPAHLAQLRLILDDPEASDNDRFVAWQLLKNANVAAGMVLPGCQDTGTAVVYGWKGQRLWTDGRDGEALARGIYRSYADGNLRYSQMAPLDMYKERNTGTNLPAEFDLFAADGEANAEAYRFLFVAKGGGSANKAFLYQATPSILMPDLLVDFLADKIKTLGTQACPPYHLSIVIGGTSAELTMKTVKLASCHYYDGLPSAGNALGHAFRDLEMEHAIHQRARATGIGAQFGGKYFCHDVRVIRLPRHGASLPIGLGVSCSADRQAKAKITADGLFLEQLETDPARYLPEVDPATLGGEVVAIDLNRPMAEVLAALGAHPIKTRLALTGSLIVARDLAHARLRRRLESGGGLPELFKRHPIYYAGPAKRPDGYASGSFGPTTAGRMDSYMDQFMAEGGALISLAKGNRSAVVRAACRKHGGFYLGSIGGPAALLAQESIKQVELVDFEDLGMEAIWRIEVEDFPAFIVIDDKGNDFFAQI